MELQKSRIYKHQDIFFKILLLVVCTAVTVYIFPNNDRFKYDYKQGEPWEYETLYAPFAFPIEKTEGELKQERQEAEASAPRYFLVETDVPGLVKNAWDESAKNLQNDSVSNRQLRNFRNAGRELIDDIYRYGYLNQPMELESDHPILLQTGDKITDQTYGQITLPKDLGELLNKKFKGLDLPGISAARLKRSFVEILEPNVSYDEELTDAAIRDELNKILPTRGLVRRNARIIAQGEIVEGDKLQILNTLNNTYQSQTWSDSQYAWKLMGYLLLVAMAYTMLMLFIWRYRTPIFENFKKLVFIYFNISVFVVLTVATVNLNVEYIYVVPVCILPLIIKAFFDSRLGLFCHVIAIFVLSFIVPNSDEYLFLQMMAGIVTILSGNEIYKRANLFITVGQICLVYFISYFAFYSINQGGVTGWEWERVAYFALCGLAMLFVWPLIYILEKTFGIVSDVSLLELSDTNSRLLKELSNKAPGTFHHSLNVANIAESVANEIGANAMLVRVGALYHDVGKMSNPTYFTENQGSGINPHDDLDPEESAQIIIDHTIKGIEIAKKYNLPDRIIDFIRTHHGDSLVYYFYQKAKQNNPDVEEERFRYPGPRPFSQETAILMIADSVEAASKSLKNPTSVAIDELVNKIMDGQVKSGQFLNANITFKQLESIKSVIKKKLASIYHLRIEYPE
ncbi:HD family phosphohydrolase [Nonlabens xiamenensis]|uniref:HD family phosphohydrolase n=1 Tax=Nonlabens xiamenensis TaxID=2341043 RepID=UPI000F60C963|nr:HDIG domain-containing metalloprotein [Nonlabens xiamenensis]